MNKEIMKKQININFIFEYEINYWGMRHEDNEYAIKAYLIYGKQTILMDRYFNAKTTDRKKFKEIFGISMFQVKKQILKGEKQWK